MNRPLLIVGLILAGSSALAESKVMDITWATLKLKAGEIVTRDGVQMVRVSNPTGKPLRLTVFEIDRLRITSDAYAVRGKVAYEGVKGKAYLETLNYFQKGGPFFSRTLEPRGEMRCITGTSQPRDFFLPFFLKGDAKPTRIELNVFLPGHGTIYVGPARLVQDIFGADQQSREGALAGIVMGAIGTLIGLLGGAIGVLSSQGRGRAFVLGSLTFMVGLGVVCGVIAIAAIVTERGASIYLPLLVLAALLVLIAVFVRPQIVRRYDELELRRITARDAEG